MINRSRISRPSSLLLLLFALVGAGCAPRGAVVSAPVSVPGIRVVDVSTKADVDFATVVQLASGVDVVFFGENHDDPETHRVELGLLEAVGRTGRPVILSLEMFERDAQPLLTEYLAGRITEADFLAKSRPWDRYVTDYRPMVELAKAKGWPVVASNIPRPMASAVGRKALAALDTLTPVERSWAARDIQCPDDAYRARFMDTMRGHSSGGAAPSPADTLPTAAANRFYLAQCVKDETMAESIVEARRRSPGAIVVHYDGAFHSDYRQGTVDRVKRREPNLRLMVLTAVPVVDQVAATLADHAGRADYIIFTKRIPPKPPAKD
ncbi:MAG TPA: ChaN family lipoprotein [Gemmatimonadaceae bacterium]